MKHQSTGLSAAFGIQPRRSKLCLMTIALMAATIATTDAQGVTTLINSYKRITNYLYGRSSPPSDTDGLDPSKLPDHLMDSKSERFPIAKEEILKDGEINLVRSKSESDLGRESGPNNSLLSRKAKKANDDMYLADKSAVGGVQNVILSGLGGSKEGAKLKTTTGATARSVTTHGDGRQATGSGDPIVTTRLNGNNAETTSKTAGGNTAHQVTHSGDTIEKIETINPSQTGGTTVSTRAIGNNAGANTQTAAGGTVRLVTTQGDGGQATGTKTEATATGSGNSVVSTHPGRTNAETTSKTAGGDIAHQATHSGDTIEKIETINPSRTGGTTVSTRAIGNNAGANTQTAAGGIAGSVTTGGNGRQSSETTTEAVARTSGGAAAATDTTGANNVGHGTGTSTVSNGRPPATRSPDASPDGEPGLASPETVDANKEKRKDAKIRAATLGLVAGSAAVGVTSLGLQGISMANQQAGSNNANNTTTTQAPPTQSKPFIQPIVGDGYPTGYPQLGVPFPGSLPTGMPPNGPFPQSVSPATFPPVVRTLSTILTPQRLRGLIVNPRQ